MSLKNYVYKKWPTTLVVLVFLVAFIIALFYLKKVYTEQGIEKFGNSLILIASIFIGLAYIILFIFRKIYEKYNDSSTKLLKRRLEKYRNVINYITPFILLAMLYHFWQKAWYLSVVIVVVLLLDRLNELRRKLK